MKFRVLVEQDEDGVYVAEVPLLPGCITQGTTRQEALRNAHEAIQAHVESRRAHGDPIPPPITEEVILLFGTMSRHTAGSLVRALDLAKPCCG